jgi:LmbE family N-acetylglucosaminyl deacetylase
VSGAEPVALAVSPHPDDELIPAGGTMVLLRDAGWRVVNVCCSLGRPGDEERRREELAEACRIAGFELDLPPEPIGLSDEDAGGLVRSLVRDRLERYRPRVVLAPGIADGHPAHEVVSAAVSAAVADVGRPQTVWFWELWGFLAEATLLVRTDEVLDRVCAALEAHRGELARNDFRRLVRARATVASVLGPERVFGFGADGVSYEAAEVLCEMLFAEGEWGLGEPRELRPA